MKNIFSFLFITLLIGCTVNNKPSQEVLKDENQDSISKTRSVSEIDSLIEEESYEELEEGKEKPLVIQGKSKVKTLKFPRYNSPLKSCGCDSLNRVTPKNVRLCIYSDTIIDMSLFDSRLSIKLKFNWFYDSENVIGVQSVDVIKGGAVIYNMDIKSIMEMEAFEDDERHIPVRNDIFLEDINMDSYLDFTITWVCGKACYYSYWVYNVDREIFEVNNELRFMRPYFRDCTNRIIYSYRGGTANDMDFDAFKVGVNGKLVLYQSLWREYFGDFSVDTYYNVDREVIKSENVFLDAE